MSEHPPQLTMQSATSAATAAALTSETSSRALNFPAALSASAASLISDRIISPLLQAIARTPHAPRRKDFITRGNSHAYNHYFTARRKLAVSVFRSQSRKAALGDPSFCLLAVSGRAPLQGAGNLVRLSEGFALATRSCLPKPISTPINHLSACKIDVDDLGHNAFLKAAPGLGASPT